LTVDISKIQVLLVSALNAIKHWLAKQ